MQKRRGRGGALNPLAGQKRNKDNGNVTRRRRKWQSILAALVAGQSLTRFVAARWYGDTALNTTISQLAARGIVIDRRCEVVRGHFGLTWCRRYRLASQSRRRALELLGEARAPRT